jgi:tellurite resistance protein
MCVAVLKADGKNKAEEFETIRAIAQDLELDMNEVEACIANELNATRELSCVAAEVKAEDAEIIMQACVAVVLADKNVAEKEVALLLEIAQMLKLNTAKVVLAIATFAQNDRSIKIEGNDTPDMEDEVEVEE